MFYSENDNQFAQYRKALAHFRDSEDKLEILERFVLNDIKGFVSSKLREIVVDYNEASYLNPFWRNYPPEERGGQPIGDQFPWIEVGEHVFGPKLLR